MMRKSVLKQVYLFFSSLFIFIIHIPFVFAKHKPVVECKPKLTRIEATAHHGSSLILEKSVIENKVGSVYDSLRLNLMGLSRQAFEYAMKGFDYLVKAGKLGNEKILSIVDFSQPSGRKRLFVIDLDKYKVVFNTYVAHGMNSGLEYARQFSNSPASNKSSLGFYETMTTYNGKNGYSLQLQGLESGINDNANVRAIVMHGAPYVSESTVQAKGFIGRSWGCPAIPENMKKPIIDKIKNGTCLFIYSPDNNYLNRSRILHPNGA